MRKLIIYIECLIVRVFNVDRDSSVIPKGHYCYEIDEERNKTEPLKNGYWTRPCPYYRHLKRDSRACTYIGFYGWDVCLWDQCKICGENER